MGTMLVLGVACATPVGVMRVSPQAAQRSLTRNVLTSDRLSNPTRNVLFKRNLVALFDDDPERALADLHATIVAGSESRGDLFALAELSFYHAQDTGKRSYYLAAAVYAYTFLFPGGELRLPEPTDPRLRIAADLYNRGLSEGFASADRSEVELKSGTFALPFGWLDVDFDPANLRWRARKLDHFSSMADFDVRGLPTRYRRPGIGAPLAASTSPLDAERGYDDFVEPWAKIPASAVLRIEEPRGQLASGRIAAALTLTTPDVAETVDIAGTPVPIEVESTATLAYTLAESPVWQQEIAGFLEGAGLIDAKGQLAALAPYQPGRVPVVLVHGTASSAGRWAAMINELANDTQLRGRIQFWLFSYNTGNPILYSAMLLREALTNAVTKFDAEGQDPALHRMVVIGHSQGGLLTKLTSVESGDRFWRNASHRSFDEVDLDPKTRDLFRRGLFVHPLPFVRRVVFLSTPHRGSYFAGNWLSHWAARFITFPLDITHAVTNVLMRMGDTQTFAALGQLLPTAVDNMTPGSSFAKTISSLPIAPGVAANSIIAVQGNGPIETGDDGIVEYQSAHIDGVESEYVVRSGHSCQDNPLTIAEVRRILLEDLSRP